MSSLFENTLMLHQATIILRQIFDFCVVACDDLEDSRSHVTSPTNVKGQKGQNKLSKTTSFHSFRISIVISRGINKSIQWFWEKVAKFCGSKYNTTWELYIITSNSSSNIWWLAIFGKWNLQIVKWFQFPKCGKNKKETDPESSTQWF